jgi:hypothetical protein
MTSCLAKALCYLFITTFKQVAYAAAPDKHTTYLAGKSGRLYTPLYLYPLINKCWVLLHYFLFVFKYINPVI